MSEVGAPSRAAPGVRRGREGLGGPLGRRVRSDPHRWWTPLRVMLALVFVVSGLGLVQKEHCRAHGWTAPGQYSHACYSDIPPLYFARGLAQGDIPYIGQAPDQRVEYPVLTGAAMWVTAKLVPSGDDAAARARWYFDINALAIALCAAVAVAATVRTAGRRPWDAALFAGAPLLALTGTINWDMYAVALLSVGMYFWAHSRPLAAGVLIGLATAAKFYPLFVLGPMFVLCLRAGRLRDFWRAAGGALAAWLVVNVPVMIADFDGWSRFYTLSRERGAGFSSIWFVLSQQGHTLSQGALNLAAGGLFVLACGAIAALILTAERRPRLPQVAFLVVAAFLLTNKVYSPQYVLWLLPLAALARPRWRDVLIWQAGEIIHFVGIWLLIVGYQPESANRSLGADPYGLTVLAHILGTAWLMAMVVRDIRRPEHDPVRVDGSDDPAGGPLDHAPDVFTLPRSRTPAPTPAPTPA
ncbi:MAG: glycosyltransferase family 87 protein [Actinomycetes bacterium]